MMSEAAGFFTRVADGFSRWIGFGWSAAFLIWLAGAIFILKAVHRFFFDRFGSNLPTAVVLLLWTSVVLGIAGKLLGFGPPAAP